MEAWQQIKGWSNYEVSSYGRVRSKERIKYNRGNKTICKLKGKILKQRVGKDGYAYVTLYESGQINKRKTYKVHRLVAEYFCKKEPELVVNHLNGNKLDNAHYNLEWCTQSENIRHSFRLGLSDQSGSSNNNAKLTDYNIAQIKYDYHQLGDRQKEIAERFGVSQATISKIVNNKSYV